MRTLTLIILTTLSACGNNDTTDTLETDSGIIETGGNTSTGGNTATGGTTGPSSTVIDGITIHNDMSGYTYTCSTPSQQVIACMPTISSEVAKQYVYCSTMLTRECQTPGQIYECWSC
jgi:hypothetical protein